MSQTTGAIPIHKFPEPNPREYCRNKLMDQLNGWDKDNPAIAKATAITLIKLLEEQFDINPSLEIVGLPLDTSSETSYYADGNPLPIKLEL